MDTLLKELNGGSIGIVLGAIVVFVEYLRMYFTTNLDLLFMNKKEEQKRFLARFMVLCCMVIILNYILAIDKSVLLIDVILLFLTYISKIVLFCTKIGIDYLKKHSKKIRMWMEKCYKNNKKYIAWEKVKEYYQLMPLLTIGPIVTFFITTINEYDFRWGVIIISAMETFLIYIICGGFVAKETKIVIRKRENKESYYVYKKINEKYLLCGDTAIMEKAAEIFTIDIEDLYSKEYFLTIKKP